MSVMKVVAMPGYDRRARKLFTSAERALRAPPVPRITGQAAGARAISNSAPARARRGGRGKSGGVRIIYYFVSRRGTVFLLDVYAKSGKEDLTDAETREIRKLIATIEAEE
jgi:hypothetical protein